MPDLEMLILSILEFLESAWNILRFPSQEIDDFSTSMVDLMLEYGLDPIFTCTLFANLLALSYWKIYRNWKTQSKHTRDFAILAVIVAAMFNLISLLKLLGVIDL